ncbi:hypothetical protein C8F01DRAFT_1106178 [Mycena amicta]|nr:hypothetical protein C8F01DRAFT_1106178 [Mycena amicta]
MELDSSCFDFTAPPTPFADHLAASNRAPTELEAAMMNAFLDECDDKVDGLESAMEELRQKHTRMLEQVATYRKVMSAVRRLPGDVLGEVASLLVDDAGAILPPWTLSAVCASWRFALTRYPSLWATMKPGNPEKVQLQVERTGGASLRVWVQHDTAENLRAFLELLLPHCRRWGLLCIGDLHHDIDQDGLGLLEAAKGKLDRLVDLRLFYPRLHPPIPDLFLVAPALRKFHLFGFWGTSLQFPWRQITHFSVDEMNVQSSDLVSLLRSMPYLAQCVLGMWWRSIPVDSQPLHLAHLRVLHVLNGGLFPYLTTPSLETLVIRDPGPIAELEFLKRSSCRITTLIVDFTGEARMTQVISILKLCPELTHLLLYRSEEAAGLHDDKDNEECELLFNTLCIPSDLTDSTEIICPHLTHFLFAMDTDETFRKLENLVDNSFIFYLDDCESTRAKIPPEGPREDLADAFSKMLDSRWLPRRRARGRFDPLQFVRVGRQDKMLHLATERASRALHLDAKVILHRSIERILCDLRGCPLDWPLLG